MAKKKDDIKDEELLAKLRDKFYDPKPGETDYSATMSFEEYVKRIGPAKKAAGGMVKGFSPIARPQRFKGVF